MHVEETAVLNEVRRVGPLAAYRRLLAANDELIRGRDLTNGRAIAEMRTAIHTVLVRDWAAEQQEALAYSRPFAVVALGGTGRGEMSPRSDNDFAFLFDDALEGNAFLLDLQRQVVHSEEFRQRCGFVCLALPFSLDEVPNLTGKQLNAFLDVRPVYDPHGLTPAFRDRIRATFDPFEHFLHLRAFWRDHWEKAAIDCERVDRFDFKNDGLRVFLAGIWTLAGPEFVHSHEIYRQLEDPRDLEAYDFLMRLRAWVQLRFGGAPQPSNAGNHPEDTLTFDQFAALGDLLEPGAGAGERMAFASEVRSRLLAARRRVACFARGVMERELRKGRSVAPGNPIVLGPGGLRHSASSLAQTPTARSQAALGLLVASQRYGLPIDPAELCGTFHQAGDWLQPVPELSALFYESRGSLAGSLAFLAQIDGAQEGLFPGHGRFEASVDQHVLARRMLTRGALARRKLIAMDEFVRDGRMRLSGADLRSPVRDPGRGVSPAIEAALLDADHLAAVKLALCCKRLPVTDDEAALRADETKPLAELYTTGFSDVPLADYFAPLQARGGFPPETLRIAAFLITHRRLFKERSAAGISDAGQISELLAVCQDESRLRALFVFTCADRAEWESERTDPVRWFNTRELYAKALLRLRPSGDPVRLLRAAGYTAEEQAVLRDFGEDFFGGIYRPHAVQFGGHLLRLVQNPEFANPKAALVPDRIATIVGIAARDYRGLAATISGALWHQGVDVRQAHLFSAMRHRLALDFFHVAPQPGPVPTAVLRFVEDAIHNRRFIAEADELSLPRISGAAVLVEWRNGLHCLRFETDEAAGGLVYLLAYRVFRHLRGDIYALSAHAVRGRAFVSVYHRLPPDLALGEARRIVAAYFGS